MDSTINSLSFDLSNISPQKDNSRFGRLIQAIKKNDVLSITNIVDEFPRLEIESAISKLKRYKYQKYPAQKVAISKLKWRRGY